MEEKKENLAELSEDQLDEVSGGCWFWGLFGTHHGLAEETFTLAADDGTHKKYGRYRCQDCGKVYFTVIHVETGAQDEITEGEFNVASALWDSLYG